MLYKIITLLFAFLIPFSAQAQEGSTDYVYTKRGSLFKGKIVEYVQGDVLRLQINEGNIIVLQDKEIRKIVQGGNLKVQNYSKPMKTYDFKEKGMYYFASGQINGGSSAFNSEGTVALGLHGVVGYQWNRLLGTGVGVGMDYYYPGSSENILPVYAEVRSYLNQKRVAPYTSIQAGYGFTFIDDDRGMEDSSGGLMFHPAIGLRCGGSSNANFTIDAGIKIQKATYHFRQWELIEHKMTYRRFVLRVGVLF